MSNTHKTWFQDIILLTLLIGTLFAAFLGSRPLSVPDEARYSEIPREMVVTHDYVTPTINYIKYFEKPPFFYWMQTTAIKAFGLSEWSMRSITALMGLLGCLFTYCTARQLYNRRSGLLASLILATSFLYYAMARFITIDMTLTTLLAASLFSFILGTQQPPGKKRSIYMWSMYAFSALAMLTKGLIGIIFPGMIIFVWMLIFNDWKNLKTYCLPTGILIWLAIALPWHILMQLRNPEFFHYYFIKQQFARYLTPVEHREQPYWFLLITLIAGFLPWIIFLIPALRHNLPPSWQQRTQQKTAIFFMLWAGLIFLFFQCSHSLLPPYILPIFPALAILTARYFGFAWDKIKLRGISTGLWTVTLGMVLVFIALAVCIFQYHLIPNDKFFWLTAVIALLMAIITLIFYYRHNVKTALIIFFIGTSCTLTSANLAVTPFTANSIKPLALFLKPELKPNAQVLSYHGYYQDLPFYLQRRIIMAGWGVSELGFGLQHQNMQNWLITDKTLWNEWRGPIQMFMFLSRADYNSLIKHYPTHMYVLAQTKKNLLVTNHKIGTPQ
jgi:4-amino-4-deoxy-L-arabinose transferase-like glycosyltransferase